MAPIHLLESSRLDIQSEVDASRSRSERNRLGQFATPPTLALDILAYAKKLVDRAGSEVRFLDPAFGTGAFYSALLQTFPREQVASAMGFEIDPAYGKRAQELWERSGLDLHLSDFTAAQPPQMPKNRANMIICNPPYVRHHHLETKEKVRLQAEVFDGTHVSLSGLAGLYCYFLCLSHRWLSPDGVAGWLIPSEFMDVNYGRAVKEYLLRNVTLLRIHRFDPADVQFNDALVSSAVVWFANTPPQENHSVEFTYGGSLLAPAVVGKIPSAFLKSATKWTQFPGADRSFVVSPTQPRLRDYFEVKRGIATGANAFFILRPEEVRAHALPPEFLRPILPSPRYLEVDNINSESDGMPVIERRMLLLDCNLPEAEVKAKYPTLWRYLQSGIEQGIAEGYLCRHRMPWYVQEQRPAAPFLCTYMGRGLGRRAHPFRFLLNHSRATAANVYLLLYPRPNLADALKANPTLASLIWQALRDLPAETLMAEGRVYGGGLYKMEPKELANAPADRIRGLLPEPAAQLTFAFAAY